MIRKAFVMSFIQEWRRNTDVVIVPSGQNWGGFKKPWRNQLLYFFAYRIESAFCLRRNRRRSVLEFDCSPPICQKWWAHMKDLLAKNSDNSPVSQELREVFQIG